MKNQNTMREFVDERFVHVLGGRTMKVQVFNPEGKSVEMLQNVVNIKDCADGRKLVTYEKECICCTVVSHFKCKNIKVVIEELDEVNIVRSVQEVKNG